MKKVSTGTDLGGGPFTKADLRTIFNQEIWDAIQGLLSGYDSDIQGIIISGCLFTDHSGTTFDMTAGIVYLNGQFMRVPAVTGLAYPQYIQPDVIINDTRTFGDGGSHIVAVDSPAIVGSSIPGSGQYITINAGVAAGVIPRYKTSELNLIGMGWNQAINIPSGQSVKVTNTGLYSVASGAIDVPYSGATGQIFCMRSNANEISIIFCDDNNDFYIQQMTGGTWQGWKQFSGTASFSNLTLLNSWANVSGTHAKYRVDLFGMAFLSFSLTAPATPSSVMFNIPASIQPIAPIVMRGFNQSTGNAVDIEITSTAHISGGSASTGDVINLSCSYNPDLT